MKRPRKNGDLFASCSVNPNSVHIASNTKLMIANCHSASVLQALIWKCEAVVHELKACRLYEENILLIHWLRIIDFDRSFFAARITTRLVITDLTPRDHRREGSSRVRFPKQCFGLRICISLESRNKHYRQQLIRQSQCSLQYFNYRFCHARKNGNNDPARSECRVCFEVASLSPN